MKYGKIIISLSLLLFAGGLFLAGKLEIQSNMEEMLPKNSQSLMATQEFSKYFQGDDQVLVVVEARNQEVSEAYHREAKDFLDQLAKALVKQNYIDGIIYRTDIDSIKPYGWAYVDRSVYENVERELAGGNLDEIMKILESVNQGESDQYMTNDSGTHYMMLIKTRIDSNDFVNSRMEFYDGVVEIINDILPTYKTLDAGLTGGAFIQDIEGDSVAFDGLFSTFVITILFILLMVAVFLKGLKLPLLAMYPLLLGAVLTSAVAYMIYGSLNMFSVSFALLLIGLGIDYGIHLIARYQEEKRSGKGTLVSVTIARKTTGKSIVMGAATTGFAFTAFAFARFKAFEQMGIVSAIGIGLLCIVMLVLVPYIIFIFDKKVAKPRPGLKLGFIGKIAEINTRRPLTVYLFLTGLVLISIPSVIKTEIETDLSAVYPSDIPSEKWTKVLKDHFDYDTNSLTFYVDSLEDLNFAVDGLGEDEMVQSVESILSYLPKDQAYKLEIINQVDVAFRAMGYNLFQDFNLEFMTEDSLPESIRKNYVGSQGRYRGEIIPAVNIYDQDNYRILSDRIQKLTGHYPVGLPAIMNEVTRLVKDDIILISSLCLFVVLIISWFAFKRISLALLALSPLVLTLYTIFALAPILDISFNIFSIAGFPLIIGIGIDSSIHLIHRLNEKDSLTLAQRTQETGTPIVLTALTTMAGFGSLASINHPGMSNLGLIVAIGMFLCMIYTLLLIPMGVYQLSSKPGSELMIKDMDLSELK